LPLNKATVKGHANITAYWQRAINARIICTKSAYNLRPYQDRLTFILKLNHNYSKFYREPFLENDLNPQMSSQSKSHSDFDKIFYQKKHNGYFIINYTDNVFSGMVIKDKSIELDRKIEKLYKKVISGYDCFYVKPYFEIGRDEYSTIAWFTPELIF
jgi:GLPGLI family protein